MLVVWFHLCKFCNKLNETVDLRDAYTAGKTHIGWDMQQSNEMIAIKVRTRVTLGMCGWWGDCASGEPAMLYHNTGYVGVHFLIIP